MDHSGCTPLHHACINAPDGHRSVKVSQSREYFCLQNAIPWIFYVDIIY